MSDAEASGRSGARAYLDTLEQFNPSPELQAIIHKLRAELAAEEGMPMTDEWRAAGVNPPTTRRSSNIMDKLTPYLKALFGFVTPGAIVLGSAVTEASAGHEHVTQAEWVTAIVACIVTGSLVFGVPNRDPRALHQAESVQPPKRGEVGQAVLYWALVALVVVVILGIVFGFR